jgi:hypothetical protein
MKGGRKNKTSRTTHFSKLRMARIEHAAHVGVYGEKKCLAYHPSFPSFDARHITWTVFEVGFGHCVRKSWVRLQDAFDIFTIHWENVWGRRRKMEFWSDVDHDNKVV